MRTREDVRKYLEDVDYPASRQDLTNAAQDSDAPRILFELLGLLPAATGFRDPDEVAERLERMQGMG